MEMSNFMFTQVTSKQKKVYIDDIFNDYKHKYKIKV